jgi:hypothetical protein
VGDAAMDAAFPDATVDLEFPESAILEPVRRRRRSVWHAAAAQDSDHALRCATSQASSVASDAKETPAAPAPVHPLSNNRF